MRVRSTTASVWPGRRSTPRSRARSGNMCPGRPQFCRASWPDRPAHGSSWPGRATEIPVVHPCRSQVDRDGERAFPCSDVLWVHHHRAGSSSSQRDFGQRSADHARARWAAMKLTISGVIFSRGDDEVALVFAVLVVDHDHVSGLPGSPRCFLYGTRISLLGCLDVILKVCVYLACFGTGCAGGRQSSPEGIPPEKAPEESTDFLIARKIPLGVEQVGIVGRLIGQVYRDRKQNERCDPHAQQTSPTNLPAPSFRR